MSARFREFNIDWDIEEPEEKGKISYWSLRYQVNSGIERGFEESEIIPAVIGAMSTGNAT